MAKKNEEKKLVDCRECVYGGSEVQNYLIDCSNKQRNPHGFKIGYWPQSCNYFKAK